VSAAVTFAAGVGGQASGPPEPGSTSAIPKPRQDAAAASAAQPVLTARERQIAELIARRLSNPGIAPQLVISPAATARDVATISTRLGAPSRARVAAWTAERRRD